MIYISKGYATNKLTVIKSKSSDFQTIVNSKVTTFEDISFIDTIKRTQAYFFISGELSEPTRNNDNVLSKSLITLDYDDLKLTEEEFRSHLLKKINALKFYAYPSISNGLKGTRFRAIIPTDRPYTQNESSAVIRFITSHIDLPYDAASETWSQLMSLKCTFESEEAFNDKCIYNEGIGLLKVDNALKKMAEKQAKQSKEVYKVNSSNTMRSKKYTAILLEEIVQGIQESERNVWLTKITGKLLALGMEPTESYQFITVINENFIHPPLPAKEVNTIFKSILKRESNKREVVG
ncbi:primase C-terminal domain-containing protein [Marinilactibacillus psychrotolerans]|uniref:primase C-terminal domain-containing protein n=1 Tax=Marinilactibacillus psychrotolerans TaxID=191770 RepID=UPI00388442A9